MSDDLSIVMVDDEPLALRRLNVLLSDISGTRVVGEALNCPDAIRLIVERQPDVVLLDINLRDGTGFDILDRLPDDVRPDVIFTTAFDHFAIRAFEVSAADYILKPIEPSRLDEALARIRVRRRAETTARDADATLQALAALRANLAVEPATHESEIWVRGATGTLTRVGFDQIIWVGSEEDYIRLNTRNASYLVRLSIRAFEARVDPDDFVRVHRSALVRLGAISEIRTAPGGRRVVVLDEGTRIPTGRVYAKRLRSLLRTRAVT